MSSNPRDLDGVDLWFFGGTPGPEDLDQDCTLSQRCATPIDEDDARIPAFAHQCHCGQQAQHANSTSAVSQLSVAEGRAPLMPCLA